MSQSKTSSLQKKSDWAHIGKKQANAPRYGAAHCIELNGSDLTFSFNSDKVPPPPGAAVSSRRILTDPRSEPQHAERVPYVISQGEPGAKLVDQAVSPEVMLANP